jgi:hypothetical protein
MDRGRLQKHTQAIDKAQRSIDSSAELIRELQCNLDRLALVCRAMWALLQESTDLTEEDLLEKLKEIDHQDGKEDGGHKARTRTCPQCSRPNKPNKTKCLYCGAELSFESAFDLL